MAGTSGGLMPQIWDGSAGTAQVGGPMMTATQGMPTAVQQPGAGSGQPGWLSDLTNLANLGGSIYGLVNSAGMTGDANKILADSNPFGQYRPYFGKQLMDLIQNPGSVAQQPGYQFLMDQGTQALMRSAAGPGGVGLGSGGMSTELLQYGQGLASQYYDRTLQEYAGYAGANINPANPAQALQMKGGAAGSVGSSISGLTGALPGVAQMISKLFPGNAPGTAGGGGGGAPSGIPGLSQSQYASDLSQLFSGTYGSPYTPYDTGFSNVSSNLGYDPVTGDYSGVSTPSFSQYDLSSGYSPFTGDYSGGSTLANMNLSDLGGGGSVDLSGLFSNPRAAGGEAATAAQPRPTSTPQASSPSMWGTAGSLYGIGTGLASGTPTGYAGSAIGGAKLASQYSNQIGMSQGTAMDLNKGAGIAGDVLGIYTGLQRGGVTGYTGAAANAVKLGSAVGALPSAAGAAAGYVAAPLAVYNFVENYQSGKTGSDALQGAEAGAAIGSVIPGIGTVIGGVIGGVVGGIASAFGPGAKDPETATVQKLIDYTSGHGNSPAAAQSVQNPYVMLAGLMDERHSTLPMYSQYGRMGEKQFTTDMVGKINTAINSGEFTPNSDGSFTFHTGGGKVIYNASDTTKLVYDQIIAPWVQGMGSGYSNVGSTYANVTQGLTEDMVYQYLTGQASQDWKAVGGDSPFADIYSGSQIKALAPASIPSSAASPLRNTRKGIMYA